MHTTWAEAVDDTVLTKSSLWRVTPVLRRYCSDLPRRVLIRKHWIALRLNIYNQGVKECGRPSAPSGRNCECMRGIRFNIMDVTLHTDPIHRGAGQIMPPLCVVDLLRKSQPTLHDPVFLVEKTCLQAAMRAYSCMKFRRDGVCFLGSSQQCVSRRGNRPSNSASSTIGKSFGKSTTVRRSAEHVPRFPTEEEQCSDAGRA